MKYRNIVTGMEFETKTPISAPKWERVDEPKPEPEVVVEEVKKEPKEVPKRKRSAKK